MSNEVPEMVTIKELLTLFFFLGGGGGWGGMRGLVHGRVHNLKHFVL